MTLLSAPVKAARFARLLEQERARKRLEAAAYFGCPCRLCGTYDNVTKKAASAGRSRVFCKACRVYSLAEKDCELHAVAPTHRGGRTFCPLCYSASRRKGQRTRKQAAAQREHDAKLSVPPIQFSRPELWNAFIGDVFKGAA